jgi:S-DNA-T family DNA segregation ATPase FtsK/SpoIIIE
MAGGGRITRVHGPFVSDKEVEAVVADLKKQGKPDYLQNLTEEPEEGYDSGFIKNSQMSGAEKSSGDELYDKAVAIVARDRKASTSYIQRQLQIGYNRAANIIEKMEREGVVGAANRVGKREILVEDQSEAPF